MDSHADANDLAVERFRSYLLILARGHLLGRKLGARFDASDLVQQTLLDAHREHAQFRGHTQAEMAAWLRRILACNLADALRGLGRAKRDVARERSLQSALEESSVRLEAWLAAEQSSPSERAERNERLVQLADAVATLPDGQREAVVLHYCQGLPLAEVARLLERSPAAAAGLLQRGLKALRVLLIKTE
jgi:RNA polymerase sigma-70 factor (ECF subfamily)